MPELQRQSTLAQWLAWLETLHPKEIDLSLNRIRVVLEALALEAPPYKVITVGGTNGKGSCVAYLANIYQQAGYSVGAFTSPHLVRFNERIVVNGVEATDQEIVDALYEMNRVRGKVTVSYFEASALAAAIHFARRRVDIAVLEVGMGGRLDAVNAFDADAAMIVSIGLDHEEWLGEDRNAIGYEKAGIMRSKRPVIIADEDPPATVKAAVVNTQADAFFVGKDYRYQVLDDELEVNCRSGERHRVARPGFGGTEQLGNAAAAVQLVQALMLELPVEPAALSAGIAQTAPAGRAQLRYIDDIPWYFDVAHNPDAAAKFAALLSATPIEGQTIALFGAMQDKDIRGVTAHFTTIVDQWLIMRLGSERSADPATIEEILLINGAEKVTVCENIESACAAARLQAQVGDRVAVFGSFYSVGPALDALAIYSAAPDRAP